MSHPGATSHNGPAFGPPQQPQAPQVSPETQAKFERVGKILLADHLQQATQNGVAWMSINEELGIYFIGLRSGEMRWLPRQAVETDMVAHGG